MSSLKKEEEDMGKSKLILMLLLIFGLSSSAFAQELDRALVYKMLRKALPFENLEIAGYLKNETSVRMAHGMDEFMKNQNSVQLSGNYKIWDGVEFFTTVRWFRDSLYDIEDEIYTNIDSKEKNRKLKFPEKMLWLKDCFLDIYTDRLDIRAGKQQVVWGTADGVRILDIINPLDYREWTLDDYVDSRIPLWMLNVEGELLADGHLQLLIIPDWQANYYGPPGGPFTLRTVRIGDERVNALNEAGVTVSTFDQRPAHNFKNTKIGIRWRNVIGSGYAQGLEYTLNYYHGYDAGSSAYTRFALGRPPNFRLTRRVEGIDVIGGTFSKSITHGLFGIPGLGRGWTFRGELAWIRHGAMNFGTDTNIRGTCDVDQLNYVLGFDKTFWTNWNTSLQFIQYNVQEQEKFSKNNNVLLFGPTRGPLNDQMTLLTFLLSTDFMYERLKPQILVIHTVGGDSDDRDWRISPKVSYEINDRWMVTLGAHIFEGAEQLLNGQFDKNDQIFFETKYSF